MGAPSMAPPRLSVRLFVWMMIIKVLLQTVAATFWQGHTIANLSATEVSERAALAAMYGSTRGTQWDVSELTHNGPNVWMDNAHHHCEWIGVGCIHRPVDANYTERIVTELV